MEVEVDSPTGGDLAARYTVRDFALLLFLLGGGGGVGAGLDGELGGLG